MSTKPAAPAAATLPSADLISFRFNQLTEQQSEMNKKLDTILIQNARFVPEERIQTMIDATVSKAVEPVNSVIVSYRNWGIAILGVVTTLTAALLGVFVRK